MKFNKVLLYWMTFFFVIILVYALPNYILLAEIPRLDRIVDVTNLGANLVLNGFNLTADYIIGNGSLITSVPGDGVGYNSSTINRTTFQDNAGILTINNTWWESEWATRIFVGLTNTSMKDYTDSRITNITTNIGLANDSMRTYVDLANTSSKDFTDSQISNVTDNLGLANTSVKDFIDNQITNVTTNIELANTSMKNYVDLANASLVYYVDLANTSMVDYVGLANVSVKDFVDNQITNVTTNIGLANTSMKDYVDLANTSSKDYTDSKITNVTTNLGLANASCSAYTDSANNSMRLYGDKTFVNITGDTMTGNLDVFANISASEYLKGQPLDGVLGSGIIWCNEVNVNGNVNATHIAGLNVSYPNCIARLVTTSNAVTYCNISDANVTVTDNQHSVYYVDATCAVQSVTMAVYLATDLSPGGITDIFNVYASDGEVEVVKGITVKNKETIQKRKEHFYTDHLRIESGMDLTTGPFPELNAGNGYYFYIRTRVNAVAINSTEDGMHVVYHDGTTTGWIHYNQTGINLTNCDNGSTTITCASNKLRRYVFYTIGFDSGTELHQLMPLTTDTTYNFLADCLNIESNPIAYTLPSQDNYVAVVHHIYCGFRDASSWTDGFIDIREGVVGGGAIPDTSIFLTKDMARSPEGHWDLNGYTFYNGVFNGTWNNSVNYYTYSQVDTNFTTHESFKHANATYCDDSALLDGGDASTYLDDTTIANETPRVDLIIDDYIPNNITEHESYKHDNATHSDGSSSLDGQEAGFYLDNKNCSVVDDCPSIYYYGGLSMENVTNLITSRQCSGTDKVKNITVNSSGIYILCDTDTTGGEGAGYNSTTINLSIFADNDGVLTINDSWKISNATHADDSSLFDEQPSSYYYSYGGLSMENVTNLIGSRQCSGTDKVINVTVNSSGAYILCSADLTGTGASNETVRVDLIIDDYIPNNITIVNSRFTNTTNLTSVLLANDSMRDYVDSANTSVKDYTDTVLGLANDSCTAYTDLANTSVKDYADTNFNKWSWDSVNHSGIDIITDYNSTFNQSIWDIINNVTFAYIVDVNALIASANTSVKDYTDTKITNVTTNIGLANDSMKAYGDASFNKWTWNSINHSGVDFIVDFNLTINQSIWDIIKNGTYINVTSAFGGDVSGTYDNITVTNATYADDCALLDGASADTYLDDTTISNETVRVDLIIDDYIPNNISAKHDNATYADDCALLDGESADTYLDNVDTTYTNASFDLSQIPNTGNVDIGAFNFSVGHCLNWSNGFKICTK